MNSSSLQACFEIARATGDVLISVKDELVHILLSEQSLNRLVEMKE